MRSNIIKRRSLHIISGCAEDPLAAILVSVCAGKTDWTRPETHATGFKRERRGKICAGSFVQSSYCIMSWDFVTTTSEESSPERCGLVTRRMLSTWKRYIRWQSNLPLCENWTDVEPVVCLIGWRTGMVAETLKVWLPATNVTTSSIRSKLKTKQRVC